MRWSLSLWRIWVSISSLRFERMLCMIEIEIEVSDRPVSGSAENMRVAAVSSFSSYVCTVVCDIMCIGTVDRSL